MKCQRDDGICFSCPGATLTCSDNYKAVQQSDGCYKCLSNVCPCPRQTYLEGSEEYKDCQNNATCTPKTHALTEAGTMCYYSCLSGPGPALPGSPPPFTCQY